MSYQVETSPHAPQGCEKFVSTGMRHAIIVTVVMIHLCIVVIPGLVMMIYSWLKPQEIKAARVVLVDSAPNNNTAPSLHPGPSPIPNNDPLPGDPPSLPNVKLDPVPTSLPDPEPIVEPAPAPKPVPKPVPKPTPTPKPVPKPTPTPKPIPKTAQKPAPQTSQKPAPKKNRTLTADQIDFKRSSTSQKTTGRTTTNTRRGSSQNTALSSLAQDIRSSANSNSGKIGYGGSANGRGVPGGAGGTKTGDQIDVYYAVLQQFLKSRWVNQPNVDALGGAKPVVRVEFMVNGRGEILSKKIIPSGNRIMDASVSALVKSLQRLPAPPSGKSMSFSVDMRIEE